MGLLKPIIQSLDEIEEGATVVLRDCYREATTEEADRLNGGKPFLKLAADSEGGWEVANTRALTGALELGRKAERTLDRFGRITPDEAKSAVAEVGELRETVADLKRSGKGSSDWEKQKGDLVTAHQTELTTKDQAIANLRGDLHGRVIRDVAISALKKAGFSDHADLMLPALEPLLDYAPGENGSQGRTRVMRADRETVRLDASGQDMSPEQMAAELAGDVAYKILLDADGASGGGGTGGGSGGPLATTRQVGAPVKIVEGAPTTAAEIDAIAEFGADYDSD